MAWRATVSGLICIGDATVASPNSLLDRRNRLSAVDSQQSIWPRPLTADLNIDVFDWTLPPARANETLATCSYAACELLLPCHPLRTANS